MGENQFLLPGSRKQDLADSTKRVVPFKVIVCGLMRTGTSSIQVALRKLGMNDVYHMWSLMEHPGDSRLWTKALNAKHYNKEKLTRAEWDELLGNYQAVCDVPAALFAVELAEAYPEAKVVILNREREAWYQSCKKTIFAVKDTTSIMQVLFFLLDYRVVGQAMLFIVRMWDAELGAKLFEEHNVKTFFDEYHEDVRKKIHQSRLLEYKVQDGWRPLCDHLDLPVPTVEGSEGKIEVPFPRINDAEAFHDTIESINMACRKRVYKSVGITLSLVANLVFVFWLWKANRS